MQGHINSLTDFVHGRDVKPANIVQTAGWGTITNLGLSTANSEKKISDMFAAAIEASQKKPPSSIWIERDFLNIGKDRTESISFEHSESNVTVQHETGSLSSVKGDLTFISGSLKGSAFSKTNFVKAASNLTGTSVLGAPSNHTTVRYRLIDLGTAIAVSDAAGDSIDTGPASMMTFTAMDFAGLT